MSDNIHLFDPSTYDAKQVDKPLAQIMREAERARSHEAGRVFAAAFRWIAGLFRRKGYSAPVAPADVRKAA